MKLLGSLLRNRAAGLGTLFLFVLIGAAILAPVLLPVSPSTLSLADRLTPPTFSFFPYRYPLGSDNLGRDILARVLYGAQTSLRLGLLSVLIGGLVGSILGLIAGYFKGPIDEVIMRIADAQLAIPFVLLTISLVGALGPSERNLVIVLGLTSWVSYGRLIRSQVLSLSGMEFIEAARAMGVPTYRILFVHLLPNVLPIAVIVASFELSNVILAEAALSFLGVGIPPDIPTWGNMLGDARDYMSAAPWLILWPGLMLTLTVVNLNAVANWQRDVLDPRTRYS